MTLTGSLVRLQHRVFPNSLTDRASGLEAGRMAGSTPVRGINQQCNANLLRENENGSENGSERRR